MKNSKIRIAIVDDMCFDRGVIAEKIANYMANKDLDFEIEEFESAEQFLNAFRSGQFTLVFLDIYLGELSGMDAAYTIFEGDKDCKIIFLTISRDFAIEGYAVRAVSYLVKPFDDKEFLTAMENCELGQKEEAVLSVVSSGLELALPIKNIMYIDYSKHITQIHMENGVVKVNNSFQNVIKPLRNEKGFIVCMRGTMVNLRFVAKQEGHTFVLKNGEVLPINIRNKKALGQAFRQFHFEAMEVLI